MISLVDLLACLVIWLILYYFIFEMRIVQDKLQSECPREYMLRRRITLRSRLIIMVTVALVMLVVFGLGLDFLIILKTTPNPDENLIKPDFVTSIIDFCARIIKILIDIYMITTFIDLQTFFIREKADQLAERDSQFSCFNKFIIVWSIAVVSLNFLHSLGNVVYNPLFKYYTVF